MQARQIQIVVARDMRHRLATGEAAVDFCTLEMLAGLTVSHGPESLKGQVLLNGKDQVKVMG